MYFYIAGVQTLWTRRLPCDNTGATTPWTTVMHFVCPFKNLRCRLHCTRHIDASREQRSKTQSPLMQDQCKVGECSIGPCSTSACTVDQSSYSVGTCDTMPFI